MSNYSCTAPEACQRSTGRRFPNSTPESQETCFRPNHTCSSSSCHLLSSEHDAQGDHKYSWRSRLYKLDGVLRFTRLFPKYFRTIARSYQLLANCCRTTSVGPWSVTRWLKAGRPIYMNAEHP